MAAQYPQAHFCEKKIGGETLSQVPPQPSLEITWAVCLIGNHIVLMNNNMMWGKKGRYRPRERQQYGILLN